MLAAQVIVLLCYARILTAQEHISDQFWHNCNHPSSTPMAHKLPITSSNHLFLGPWRDEIVSGLRASGVEDGW